MIARPFAIACLILIGCASSPSSMMPSPPYEFPLKPPSAYTKNFVDRQTISATYGTHHVSFDAVLQKRGDEITLLGLTPFGTRAFALRQIGTDVTFESFVPQTLPFPPKYILIDVHRAFFDGIDDSGSAPTDGAYEARKNGEIITETWKNGRIVKRDFRRVDGIPKGDIVITYDGDRTHFQNEWFGYTLDITTVSHKELAP
jgi:hypothetical protein